MDEQRFDHLSRQFAGFRTRRQALKAIAGAVVATVAGARGTAAQDCTPPYSSCGSDDQCCAGAVCQYGLCMPGCRIDGAFQNAWTSPPGDVCRQCLPELSTAGWSPANEGMSCWSGDPNAGTTFCQSGECRSTGPSQCPPPQPCHTDELIDPATCTYSVAEAGTPCGNGPMCHGGFSQPADMCDGNGFCIGGGAQTVSCAPYVCGDGACATSCATDGDCAVGALCCGDSCVNLGTIDHCGGCDDACVAVDTCTPALCDNGTCNQASACGPVDACTPAQCLDDGTCNQLSACTGQTLCDGGACVSICLEHGDDCETAEQCCGEGQTCGPRAGNTSETGCCFELGAAGCEGSGSLDCCAHIFPDGGDSPVRCGNGICGGPGARCDPENGVHLCASGTCCGEDRNGGFCCAENEVCVNDECAPV